VIGILPKTTRTAEKIKHYIYRPEYLDLLLGGSRNRDIDVRTPERASGDTQYRYFLFASATALK
jgi:hypothetical protein